ncbi:DNA translocase FtsK [Brucepastera parasyntrophica]|uniref:FtsK/SpoIIIE family DNA translocase n=1 Tax=Brucepastera parasyntrophica TaxID=2880008 RepID=UPI002108FB5A|nr:DNA translocase FtsK [Brucepastera parasyntrophica]ULQ60939.1 DNA translocase FtsK [Brucepastera parasyntrophica]
MKHEFSGENPDNTHSESQRIVSIVIGAVFSILAVFLAISLFSAVFSFSYKKPPLAMPGDLLLSVYGISSFLVPCFLFLAAIILVIPGWSFRSAVILAGSIIPFFTAVGGEKLLKVFNSAVGTGIASRIISGGLIISIFLAVFLEYLLLIQLADWIQNKRNLPRNGEEDFPSGESDELQEEAPVSFEDEFSEPEREELQEETDAVSGEALAAGEVPDLNVNENSGTEETDPDEADMLSGGTDLIEGTYQEKNEAGNSLLWNSDNGELSLPHEQDNNATDAVPSSETGPIYIEFDSEEKPSSGDTPPQNSAGQIDPDVSYDDIPPEETQDSYEQDDPDYFDDGEEEYDEPDESDGDDDEDGYDDLSEDGDTGGEVLDVFQDTDAFPLFDSIEEESGQLTETPANGGKDSAGKSEVASFEALDKEPVRPGKKRRRLYSVPYEILNSYPDGEYWVIDDATRRSAAALKETLNEFHIQADVTGIRKGPVITMFEILPAPGVKLSKIVGLQDNIALRLAASSVRIVAPIPGKHAVGIEVPNQKRSIVSFRELIETEPQTGKKMEIPVVLGKDITGEAQIIDLTTTPHLLIAGATGSGKSVCVNSIILSVLYKRSPDEVRLLLIDPKVVELKLYNDIAHLLSPVITEPKKAFQALQYCLCEMERRYALLDGMGVRDIRSYNRRIKERNMATEKIPYIVVIIDEFADLMATTGKELESTVARLCAMSRAVGIHLVLATQRPSIDVITGLIKANIPSRIAFMVASKMDSRIIIDQVGAEKLLGRGDMLYSSVTDPFPVRIQGAFVSDEEVEKVVEYVKTFGEPEYIDEEIFFDEEDDSGIDASLFSDGEDPLYDKALEIVLLAGKASASYIQRRLKIGYNRAARLVEDMEARGIVGPANGSKPRDVVHYPSGKD